MSTGCGDELQPEPQIPQLTPDMLGPRPTDGALCPDGAAPEGVTISALFVAQSHVQRPDAPYFRLTAGRDALLKVHVVAAGAPESPPVRAVLRVGGESLELCMSGPATLPAAVESRPGRVEHSASDSFTVTIPADWVRRGLSIGVAAGSAAVLFDDINVGAPNHVVMNMVDVHFFDDQPPEDYPDGWEEEIANHWPVTGLEVRRAPDVVFPEVILPPDCSADRVPTRLTREMWDDGEQSTAAVWNGALRAASGSRGRYSLYYLNIYGVASGGQAGGFAGVGNGKNIGILHHELGHAMSLPHWGNNADYPYRDEMHGVPAPEVFNGVHVGPTWAYHQTDGAFLTPIVGPNSVGGTVGTYKKDPMQGGGQGDQEMGYIMRPFSDYSVFRMRGYLEQHIAVWNESLESWARWDDEAADYTDAFSNNGVEYPVVRDVEVISIMAASSGQHADINLVYPPVGPYTAGLIDLFDPTVAEDRERAAEIRCPEGGCDVSLRIIQGGVEKIIMLPIEWNSDAMGCENESWGTRAVNLPAADGEVTMVELLRTPDAQIDGVPGDAEVLSTWMR